MLNSTYKVVSWLKQFEEVAYTLSYHQTVLFSTQSYEKHATQTFPKRQTQLLDDLSLTYYAEVPIKAFNDPYAVVWVYDCEDGTFSISVPSIYGRDTAGAPNSENTAIGEMIMSRKPLSYPSFLFETWFVFNSSPVLMMLSELKSKNARYRFGIAEVLSKNHVMKNRDLAPNFIDLATGLPNVFYYIASFQYNGGCTVKSKCKSIVALLYIQQWERTLNAFGKKYVQMLFKTLELYIRSIADEEAILFLYNQATLGVYCSIEDYTRIKQLAENLIDYFKTPWFYDDFVFFSNVKIGVAVFPAHAESPLDLLSYANLALKDLSKSSTSDFSLFTLHMKNEISDNIVLFGEIRSAMDNGEFIMYYQPQVDMQTDKITGVEALVRWQHPERGLVSPAVFLPAISKIGLDYLLDQYVVNAVSQDQARLQALGFGDIPISFNVSGSSINTDNLFDDINDTLHMNGADPEKMIIEITETAEVFMSHNLNKKLIQLRDIGLSVSIDDFGTGFSSLNYLSSLPVDAVKIDKVFSDGYPSDEGRLFLIDKIVEMANCFDLDLTLEGVETAAQVQYFKKHLGELALSKVKIQGYFYYKPMAFDAFIACVKRDRGLDFDGAFL